MCLSRQRRMKPISPISKSTLNCVNITTKWGKDLNLHWAFIISVFLYLLKVPTLLDRHEIIVMLVNMLFCHSDASDVIPYDLAFGATIFAVMLNIASSTKLSSVGNNLFLSILYGLRYLLTM